MRIWVDIEDSAGVRQGDGPIECLTASVERPLDGIGSIKFSYPHTARSNALVLSRRRARLFVDYLGDIREIGFGIIHDIGLSEVAGGSRIANASGPDIMQELHEANVLQNRQFENATQTSISTELIGLVSGWSDTVDGGLPNTTIRADVHSVMQTYLALANKNGLHIRLGAGKTLEYGAFGDVSTVRAIGPIVDYVGVEDEDDLILIEQLVFNKKSQDLSNWIIGLGGGEGDAQLTLEHSDRSVSGGDPYDILDIANPDGTRAYHIKDATSITAFGEVRIPVTFKDIAPLSHGLNARKHAANALYDATVAYIERHKDEIQSYKITARKPKTTIKPGDKITVRYKGDLVDGDDVLVTYLDINDDFWVMDISESFADGQAVISMTVNNIDRHLLEASDMVVGAVEAVFVNNVAVQTNVIVYENTFYDSLSKRTPGASDPDKFATFKYRPAKFITDVIGVWLDFKSFFLETTAAPTFASSSYNFGIFLQDQYPSDISLFINGVDESSSYGGPWNTSAGNAQVDIQDLDITADLEAETGEIFAEHTIEFKCGQPGTTRGIEVPGFTVTTADTTHGQIMATFRTMAIASALAPV